jgi:hypothetical protein
MRAREFVINVPITIQIDGDGPPKINMRRKRLRDPQKLDNDPTMVPPLQQDLEIKKADVGKTSPVIKDLTHSEADPSQFKKIPLLHSR